ncbi:hypothetical protein BFP72_08260 [Reichenbachiella sp. 5M10]|nr:hypothetical protein BFP72_08260 [Reichenbachiella sp. 5M10]
MIPIVVLSACTEDDSENMSTDTAPTVPSSSTMAPDFGEFNDATDEGAREAMVGNWGYAAINVGVYSSILYQHLVIPVTAFKATVGAEAYFDEETELWVWERNFDVPAQSDYQIKLTADVDGDDVDWKGYISHGTDLDEFMWFEGESTVNGESGSWMLYESPENPSVWLTSDWTNEDDSDIAHVTFTVQKEGDNEGSSIEYEADASTDLDRMVTIYDASIDNEVSIMWSQASGQGRVMSEAHFQDSEYHCWDADLMDTECE